MKNKWMSYSVQGNTISILKDKLKLLKADLKVWNLHVFGHLYTHKKRILEDIEILDNQDANGDLEANTRVKRMELDGQLSLTNKKIESLVSQNARANWFKHGDSCSGFFHSEIDKSKE